MKNINVNNSCGKKRGCTVTIVLPHDSGIGTVLSGMYETKYDISKILSLANISLDKKLEAEGPLEKMAA